ncbi:MAG TPA: DUF2795 domain-containing protein [bacterium]|nr:DUF2795 domain-containing protein [bacterium]
MARGVGGKGPANIMKHMKGIKFPATKDEIVKIAQGKDQGPDTEDVVGVLKKLPEKDYTSPAEILKEVGKIE